MTGEGRTVSSLKNIFWSYLSIIVGVVLSFINRTFFLQYFGVEFLGINGLFADIISMLSLADMGFSTAMAYSYYKPIADNDIAKISALNCFYKKIYILIASVVAILGLVLVPFLENIVNLEKPIDKLYIYYILTLANTVASYLVVYKSTLIDAYQKNYIVVKYNTVIKFGITLIQILSMVLTQNYIIYLIVVIVGTLVNNIRISIAADKLYPFLKKKAMLEKVEQKSVLTNIGSMFIYKISSVLLNGTDNTLISMLVGTIWVGYYSNYNVVIIQINSLINALFRSIIPSIGNLQASEPAERQYDVFKTVQIVSFWFSSVVISTLYVLFNDFIATWLGFEYLLDGLTVFAIVFNLYLTCILQPIWIYREATGLYHRIKYVMIATAILNIVLSIILGIYLGLAGILIATALSKLLTYVWYEPKALFKEHLGRSSREFFLPSIINFAVTVLMAISCKAIYGLVSFGGWIGLILKTIIVFTLANSMYLFVYSKSLYFKSIMDRVKRIICRNIGSKYC